MAKRYFQNPYIGKAINFKDIDENFLKSNIQSIVSQIISKQKVKQHDDGGLYVGQGGVAYMLYYLQKKLPELNYLDHANNLCEAHYKSPLRSQSDGLGFLLGKSGLAALKIVLATQKGDACGQKEAEDFFRGCLPAFLTPDPLGVGSDELLVGRAGYLAGHLWLVSEGIVTLSQSQVYQVCDMMVSCGQHYSAKVRSPCPLMYQYYGTEYLGAAHGLTGILQMLLSVPGYLQHCSEAAVRDIRASVDYLLQIQTPEGNFPCAMDELRPGTRPAEDELVHWCHGAPGTVYLLARAYLVWKDEKYLEALRRASDICWEKGFLRKGPGICHGIAGTGYVFLLMYRLTQDKMFLARANCCAMFLFTQEFHTKARVPDCPLSLYEGWSGTVCFLLDLLQPDKAAFPFSDVFL